MTDRLTNQQALHNTSPPLEELTVPTRRGFLLGVTALAATTLFPSCDGHPVMHDTRFSPLAGIVENLRTLQREGTLEVENERNLGFLINNLERCKDDKCFGQVVDPELSRQIDELLTDLSTLNRADTEQVSETLVKAEKALDLLWEDEHNREMRIGMQKR